MVATSPQPFNTPCPQPLVLLLVCTPQPVSPAPHTFEVASRAQDLERFHANIAAHAAKGPALAAALAARRAEAARTNWELGLEYKWRFERLRQRVDGASCCVKPGFRGSGLRVPPRLESHLALLSGCGSGLTVSADSAACKSAEGASRCSRALAQHEHCSLITPCFASSPANRHVIASILATAGVEGGEVMLCTTNNLQADSLCREQCAAAKRAAIAARGGLFRTSSSRSGLGFGGAGWARSHYEEAQMLQRLQALERMRTMCQVRRGPAAAPRVLCC
jgi:hypothetical protein